MVLADLDSTSNAKMSFVYMLSVVEFVFGCDKYSVPSYCSMYA